MRVAVVGIGHLGGRHVEKLTRIAATSSEPLELVALCDLDGERARQAAEALPSPPRALTDYRELEGQVDAVTIATPTDDHAAVATFFLERGVHVMVEKPITPDVPAGQKLVALARANGLALAVGHVERFNPALQALRAELTTKPRYVETYRISPFSFRSVDIGVVHDLMIHDLDIILQMFGDVPVERVEAHGVGIFGKHEDLASARLVFADGSVASLTASRVSLKSERKLRLFADDLYATMDFMTRGGRVIKKGEALTSGRVDPTKIDPRTLGDNPMAFILGKLIDVRELAVDPEADALEAEIADFIDAVRNGRDPQVTGEHGVRALEIAETVVSGVASSLEQARAGRP